MFLKGQRRMKMGLACLERPGYEACAQNSFLEAVQGSRILETLLRHPFSSLFLFVFPLAKRTARKTIFWSLLALSLAILAQFRRVKYKKMVFPKSVLS